VIRVRHVPAGLAGLMVVAHSAAAAAHGFDERFDLPAPLGYFVAGATLTVALSFLLVALFARRIPASAVDTGAPPHTQLLLHPLPQALRILCQAASTGLFVIAIVAALWGTPDPMMNLAPTLVWIVWWVGLPIAVACIGNFWPLLDPWRALFEWMEWAARRIGNRGGIALGWNWPPAVGAWPAAGLLLLWSWFEVVYPAAAVPFRLGCMALAWSVITIAGMVCFGREAWQRNADMFAIYFATLGRLAPLGAGPRDKGIVVRPPGAALIAGARGSQAPPAGSVGFIIAMLSTVLFDGLHGGQAWLLLEHLLRRSVPQLLDVNGYFAGAVGLLGVWLAFVAAYELTCLVTARITGDSTGAAIARRFAPTLVPVAVAYNIAHNLSNLLVQGQNIFPLLSDPLGRRWNLFGTAAMHVNSSIIEAKLTWYVAIAAIVTGHVIAVWLAHRVALHEYRTPRIATVASIPLTALMVVYTAISLSVIAEPMVTFQQSGLTGSPAMRKVSMAQQGAVQSPLVKALSQNQSEGGVPCNYPKNAMPSWSCWAQS
jgi:hypothetical protein